MLKIKKTDLLILFLALFFSLAVFGFSPFEGNNVHYIPYLESLKNNNLFNNDYLMDALRVHPSYFYVLIIKLSSFLGVSIKLLILYMSFAVFFLQTFVVFLIAKKLFGKREIAVLALFFLLSSKYTLGMESISINLGQLTQTSFATPFALLTLLFFIKEKRKISFLMAGLICNIQPIIGFQILLMFLFVALKELVENKKIIKETATEFLIFLLGAMPIVLLFIRGKIFLQGLNGRWLEIAKIRLGHHFFPFNWSLTTWVSGIFYLGLFVFSIRIKKKNNDFCTMDKRAVDLMISFAPIFLFGFVFSQIIPIKAVILTNIFRIFIFYNFLCMVYGAYLVWWLFSSKKIITNILACFLTGFLFLPSSIYYQIDFLKPIVLAVLFFILSLSMAVILLVKNKPAFKKLLLFFLFIFLFFSCAYRLYKNYHYWGKLTFNKMENKEWTDVQLWAKKNTQTDDLFLTPVDIYGFRVYSQRAQVGDFKDGGSTLYHATLYKEWWQRMLDLGVEKEMINGAYLSGYKELDDEKRILKIAEKYNADWLISIFYDLQLNRVYNNNKYSVYKL